MPGAYLIFLLISLFGLFTLDRKYALAWAHGKRATALTLLLSAGFFLLWDAAGISMGIFFIGNTNLLTGILLAPELPLEEPVFLLLLSYSILLGYKFIERRKLGR